VTNHFKGSSLEFRAVGLKYIYLEEFDELISAQRPVTSANNIIFGQLYVDIYGEVIVKNLKTREFCRINISK
jgi:hypothetical protein